VNEVSLSVNGKRYVGWQDIQVEKSLSALCGAFQVQLIDTRPLDKSDWPINMGDQVKVYINDQLLLTGYVDDINMEYDETRHSILIAGRDALEDLVDCHRAVGQRREWLSQTPEAIIRALVAPFGTSVRFDTAALSAAREEMFSISDGDTVHETIRKLCRKHNVQMLTHGDGVLVFTRTGSERAVDRLETGINILRGGLKQSNRDRFSHYYVKGTAIGFDEKTVADFAHPKGEARDQLISRYRPYVIIEDTNTNIGNCSTRAKAEAALRAGRSRVYEYDVPGWLQSDGSVWKLNQLVELKERRHAFDGTLLIDQIRFVQSTDAQRTTLQLCSPEKYKAEADLEKMKTAFDPLASILAGAA